MGSIEIPGLAARENTQDSTASRLSALRQEAEQHRQLDAQPAAGQEENTRLRVENYSHRLSQVRFEAMVDHKDALSELKSEIDQHAEMLQERARQGQIPEDDARLANLTMASGRMQRALEDRGVMAETGNAVLTAAQGFAIYTALGAIHPALGIAGGIGVPILTNYAGNLGARFGLSARNTRTAVRGLTLAAALPFVAAGTMTGGMGLTFMGLGAGGYLLQRYMQSRSA